MQVNYDYALINSFDIFINVFSYFIILSESLSWHLMQRWVMGGSVPTYLPQRNEPKINNN